MHFEQQVPDCAPGHEHEFDFLTDDRGNALPPTGPRRDKRGLTETVTQCCHCGLLEISGRALTWHPQRGYGETWQCRYERPGE